MPDPVARTRPTLDDVAAAAGVSRMTVSNAYNRPDQLSAATRARVLEAAHRLGYGGPDPAARSLRRGRAGAVGVLLSEQVAYAFDDPGLVQLLHGIASALGEAGLGLLLVPAVDDTGQRLVRDSAVDAYVGIALAADDPALVAVRERHLPLVTIGGPRLRGVPSVGIDNVAAARGVARHLLDLGHTRFGVLETAAAERRPQIGLRERTQGFVEEVTAALGADADIRVVAAQRNDRAAARTAAAALLDGRSRPTAVFAVTDVLAFGLLDAAAERDVAVPGRLSVVGFDDVDDAASSTPPLTTVRQRLADQGRVAVETALGLLEGRQIRPARQRTTLVVRESTGPLRPARQPRRGH